MIKPFASSATFKFFPYLILSMVFSCSQVQDAPQSALARRFTTLFHSREYGPIQPVCRGQALQKISHVARMAQSIVFDADRPRFWFIVSDSSVDSASARFKISVFSDESAFGAAKPTQFELLLGKDSVWYISDYRYLRNDHDFR